MDDKNDLAEEVFCLNYELNTLANVLLRHESERWVPGFLYETTERSHTDRYKLACQYTAGKNVIDVACGIGKGSNIIATDGAAASVSGFDIQPDAIRYAKWRNGKNNIEFAVNNAEALGIINRYDVAISFETVEHLPNYRDFFISIKNCLKPGGLFLISTPISAQAVDVNPTNPYHVQEWGFNEFQHILKEFFEIEKVYIQLYPQPAITTVKHPGIFRRAVNKLNRTLFGHTTTTLINNNAVDPFSKIEAYSGQYPVEALGVSRFGYQIVLAKAV